MSPAIIFTTKGEIMALKSKNQETLHEEFEVNEVEQITFDDVIGSVEAEYVDEDELENGGKKYFTISGKESQYEPSWEKYGIQDLGIGATMEGRPEINIFENDDKTYDALRLRIMDDGEILDLYINYPKKHFPYVRAINSKFDFYRKCFDFIFSVLRLQGEQYVVDQNGDEVNKFGKIDIEKLAKYVDQHARIGVEITEGNSDSEYDSFKIYKLE